MTDSVAVQKPSSLLWTIRAPDQQKRQILRDYTEAVKDEGLDVCRVTIGFAESWLAAKQGRKEGSELQAMGKTEIHIHQDNTFNYQVQKPRREPYTLSCVKPEFRRTFSSILFEAYVLDKARRKLKGEFCFRDYLELDHDAFRRIIMRLKRKGLVVRIPERTMPQMYLLAEEIKVL